MDFTIPTDGSVELAVATGAGTVRQTWSYHGANRAILFAAGNSIVHGYDLMTQNLGAGEGLSV